LGARDLENGTIEVARRDTLTKESRPIEGIADYVADLLNEIQASIYQKALEFPRAQTLFRSIIGRI
jgi:prolyl-tRNA synthetase